MKKKQTFRSGKISEILSLMLLSLYNNNDTKIGQSKIQMKMIDLSYLKKINSKSLKIVLANHML